MRGRTKAWIIAPTLVVVAAGIYAVGDAYDYFPGILTTEPELPAPAPFLSAGEVSAAAVPAAAVLPTTADAPLPSADIVQALAEQVRADSRTGSSTNVSVVDVLTGEVLADVDADDTQVPASTTKLLTGVAAVADLGPDYRMTTQVTWDEASRTVTLVAGGDMMLAADAGHYGAGADANGWAGLGDLADAVVVAVPDVVDGAAVNVAVDDSIFEGPAVNPEWPAYAFDQGYVGAATGVAVDVGRTDDEHYSTRHKDPSLAAARDFAAVLEARGVTTGSGVERAASPAGATAIASVEGAPLSEVVHVVERDSDNTIAEIVGRVHALETGRPTTPAGASEAMLAGLESIGVDTDGLVIRDGAGFSVNNRISPKHLVDTIIAALNAEPTADLLDWLPVGGLEGTVGGRYESEPAAGAVRAKTGSLTGVTTLAGTIQTAEGRLLAFAIMADGMPYGPSAPRDAFDEMVNALAECGCEN